MRTALIYNFLIEANIMASIAILLMMALRKTLRRQLGNGALCFGWLLVALRLLLPLSLPNPLINAIRSPFAMDSAIRPIAGQIKVRLTDALSDLGYRLYYNQHVAAGNRMIDLSWRMENADLAITLAWLYLLGAAAVLGWFIFSNVRFRWRLRVGRIEPISGKLLAQYEAVCAQRGIRPVPVYFTDPLPSACLVGVFRPYIALPLTASPQDAIQVLTHEVCHLKNRDHLWSLLRLACCVLHWFNPLVWIAAAMSRTDGELRCDDRVAAPMDQTQRQAYANVLVLAAARRNAPGLGVLATGMTMTGKRLKARVVTILKEARPLRWLSVCFMLISSMCLVGAFATSELLPDPRLSAVQGDVRQTVDGEAEALRYARALWSLDSLGTPEAADYRWTYEEGMSGENLHVVTAGPSDNETLLTAVFDGQGNIYSLYNSAVDPDNLWGAGDTLSEAEQEQLQDSLLDFLASVNPNAAAKAKHAFIYSESWMDSQRFVYVSFWQADRGYDNFQDRVADAVVQIAPVVRVVRLTVYDETSGYDPGGNG